MTWSRFDDRATESIKVRRAGTAGCALWFAAVNFCNQHHTDGVIARDLLTEVWRPIGEVFDHESAARACVREGLFELLPSGDYLVHDFLEYNPSKIEAKAAAKANAERQRRHRERKTNGAPVTPLLTGYAGRVSNADPVTSTSNALVTPEVSHEPVTLPRPVPSRPVPSPERGSRDVRQCDPNTDTGRWILWLSLRAEAGHGDDAPASQVGLEHLWQSVERGGAKRLGLDSAAAFRALLGAWLTCPVDVLPPPGKGKAYPLDRTGLWLNSSVAASLIEYVAKGSQPAKPTASDEVARRRQLAAQRDARPA